MSGYRDDYNASYVTDLNNATCQQSDRHENPIKVLLWRSSCRMQSAAVWPWRQWWTKETVSTSRRQWCTRRATSQLCCPTTRTLPSATTRPGSASLSATAATLNVWTSTSLSSALQITRANCVKYSSCKQWIQKATFKTTRLLTCTVTS